MRTLLLIIASVLALADFGTAARAAEQKQARNPQQWRYTFHNDQWWYWLPEARWVYWQDNRWNDYQPPVRRGTVVSTTPGILCAFDEAQRQTSGVPAQSEVARSSDNREATSDVGPSYGHAGSAVVHRALVVNAEDGPYYGKADTDLRYPVTSANSDVGPFYGKADSSTQSSANMGHFPDY
jgi:hypothetical protein